MQLLRRASARTHSAAVDKQEPRTSSARGSLFVSPLVQAYALHGHTGHMGNRCISLFEWLEARRLLSVTLHNSLLQITGTRGADLITLSTATNPFLPMPFPAQIAVSINGQRTLFDVSAITSIRIFGLAGDDLIYASGLDPTDFDLPGLADFPLPVFINGGAGIDAIGGTDLNDTLIGGDGNDVIFARSGNDRILGGDGDNVIHRRTGNGDNLRRPG